MSKFHNDQSRASDPLGLVVSEQKLRRLEPGLFGWRGLFFKDRWGKRVLRARDARVMLAEHMQTGDSRAAVVVSVEPLVVAAYTDEQDAVLLLEFPVWLVAEHGLRVGTRLLTVNTYGRGARMMPDIVEGPLTTGRWQNFYPVIAEFVCESMEPIERRKRAIGEKEWRRAGEMGRALMGRGGWTARDGRPMRSRFPAGKGRK